MDFDIKKAQNKVIALQKKSRKANRKLKTRNIKYLRKHRLLQ